MVIVEDFLKCPHCKEITIFLEFEVKYTSEDRPDLFGEPTKFARIEEDGSITYTIGRAYAQYNIYIDYNLPDSKVNYVLEARTSKKQSGEVALEAKCPNCGEWFTLDEDIGPSAYYVDPYVVQGVPIDLIPNEAIFYKSNKEGSL